MSSIILSILGIYIFILLGFIAKKSFKERIDDKTITLINVYFLQVFLTFWGLLVRPVDITLIYAPILYFVIIIFVLIFSLIFVRKIFKEKKDYSIAMVASLIGNTGNLGIPLGIAIFGEESIPYTTIINLVNVFIVFTIGVFYYSRGSYDVKTSLLNIVKLPILWAALVAIVLSANSYKPDDAIMEILKMGAYSSMTMQLFLFGIYLYDVQIKEIGKTLLTWVLGLKFIIIPLVAFVVLSFVELDSTIKGIIFIELLMPIAIANVNFASLYECKPRVVTALVFISSFMFLAIIFAGVAILPYL
jgi:predicted permease